MSNNHANNIDRELVIREATAGDLPALKRLAELDSSRLPSDPVLVAACGGEVLAAVSAIDGQVIADPWQATAHVVEVLQIGARLRPDADGSGVRGLGRPRWGRKAQKRAPRPSSPSVPGLPAVPSN